MLTPESSALITKSGMLTSKSGMLTPKSGMLTLETGFPSRVPAGPRLGSMNPVPLLFISGKMCSTASDIVCDLISPENLTQHPYRRKDMGKECLA